MLSTAFTLLVLTLAPCDDQSLAGTQIDTRHGEAIARQLETLDRADTTAWFELGTLFVNRIFIMESTHKRQDADSALFYLKRAQAVCPDNPVIAGYIAVATSLRAKEDRWFRKITGKTTRQAHDAFVQMDSILTAQPENLAVQFLSASMFRDAPKQFEDARKFQLQSYELFQKLHRLALNGQHSEFFNDDVYGHVLLSLAILVQKLETFADVPSPACQYIETLLSHFPDSPAAKYVNDKNLRCN